MKKAEVTEMGTENFPRGFVEESMDLLIWKVDRERMKLIGGY